MVIAGAPADAAMFTILTTESIPADGLVIVILSIAPGGSLPIPSLSFSHLKPNFKVAILLQATGKVIEKAVH